MPKRRVLILKLASMGDLVHLLPAITDAKKADPDLVFDWVVDKNFAEVASWHPAVENIICTNHRKWRSSWWKKSTREEFSSMIKKLRANSYDLIIDAQGNIKTALLSLLIKGKKSGFNGDSIQEFGAHFFYHQKISASKNDHAIKRLRTLLASSLGYSLENSSPVYGIDQKKLKAPAISLPSSYLVFVPIASYPSKLWPDACWQELIDQAKTLNLSILIPWGNEKERQRAISFTSSQVIVLPKLTLSEIAHILLHAKAVVSMDTGLSHISAALDIPCITLYGPTDPAITGTVGKNQFHLTGPCPCLGKRSCNQAKEPVCLSQITPSLVFNNLKKILL